MCILCFETFDHLHDELVLVLDEYVLLPLVDDSVDLEITLIGFGSKNWAINMCITLVIMYLLLRTEMGEVYKGRVPLCSPASQLPNQSRPSWEIVTLEWIFGIRIDGCFRLKTCSIARDQVELSKKAWRELLMFRKLGIVQHIRFWEICVYVWESSCFRYIYSLK